jgi:hypothetical protein
MDPITANLIASLAIQSLHAYFTWMQMQGKSPDEIDAFYESQLAEFNKRDPATAPRP